MAESKEELKSFLKKVKEDSGLNSILKKKKKYDGIWSHHFTTNKWRNNGNCNRFFFVFFFGQGPKSLCTVTAAMKLKDASSLEGNL